MDKYTKIKVVGKGSFGYAVLVQSNIPPKKYYIIKIIDISKMDRKQREEALNEVHVLKAMRHPYIITYRESFMEKRCLCIVMDFADGGDLYTKIAKQKEKKQLFQEKQILDWFVQMALALKHVHDRKILHRDLKTQNIFLTAKNDVKIGDFGIARVLQHTYDCAKTAIGTPYYLSPEICQEKPYNQKSDIWSLGCILYELTTLQHAFDANSMKNLVLKILKGNYPQIPTQYSDDLKQLIADMLIKDPAKRPSIRKILERDFLKARIGELFQNTLNKQEFSDNMESSNNNDQNKSISSNQSSNKNLQVSENQGNNNSSQGQIQQQQQQLIQQQQQQQQLQQQQQNSQQKLQKQQQNYQQNLSNQNSQQKIDQIPRQNNSYVNIKQQQQQQIQNQQQTNLNQNGQQFINHQIQSNPQTPSYQQINMQSKNTSSASLQNKTPLRSNNHQLKENNSQINLPPQRAQSPYVPQPQKSQPAQQPQAFIQQQILLMQQQQMIQQQQYQNQNNSNRSQSKENNLRQVSQQVIQENMKYLQEQNQIQNNNQNQNYQIIDQQQKNFKIQNQSGSTKNIINDSNNQTPQNQQIVQQQNLNFGKKNAQNPNQYEDQGYQVLLESMRDCLNLKKNSQKQGQNDEEEDELIEDKEIIVPKFLEMNGKPFQIPGISDKDTTGLKIEALRYYLEKQIGLQSFMTSYNLIQNNSSNQDDSQLLLKVLGNQNIKYIPLIYQLIVCEESYYENQNQI